MSPLPDPVQQQTDTQTVTPASDLPAAANGAVPIEPAGVSLDGTVETPTPLPAQPDRRKSDQPPVSGVERRQSVVDRRAGIDRRVVNIGSPTGLERRRGPGRRRTDDRRSAEEGEMTDEQFEFVLAIDTYKRLNNRPFPSWTEVLEVIKQLGYRKVAQSTLNLPGLAKGGAAAKAGELD